MLLEGQLAFQVEGAFGELEVLRGRNIGPVLRKAEFDDIQGELCLERIGKWDGLSFQIERRPVDPEGQGRGHEGFPVLLARGEAGQFEVDLVDDVRHTFGFVLEDHGSVAQGEGLDDDGEEHAAVSLLGSRFGRSLREVGKVGAAVLVEADMQARALQARLANDEGQARQGTEFQVGVQAVEGDEVLVPASFPDGESLDVHRQGKGVQTDVLDADLPVQGRGNLLHQHVSDDARQKEKAERGVERHAACQHGQGLLPPSQ